MAEENNALRIVEPWALLIARTPAPAELVEAAGRTCYKSEPKGRPDAFVKMILGKKHHSVLEHASASFRFVTDRGISHEIVRHRLASYCLSGDTVVHAFSSTPSRVKKCWRVADLFAWQDDPKRKSRVQLIRLRSFDEGSGLLVPGKIRKILQSGEKSTFSISTESGRVLRASEDHRILTEVGWKRLGDISVGERIRANGVSAELSLEWLTTKYTTENKTRAELSAMLGISESRIQKSLREFGIKKPLWLRKNRRPGHGVPGMHGAAGRSAIAARMQGAGNHRWAGSAIQENSGRLRAQKMYSAGECSACGSLRRPERHHIDKDPRNNAPENVRVLCPTCHKAWHFGASVHCAFLDRVVAITPAGREMTYDIEMEGPHHNFAADGIIVHNSQESTRFVNYSENGRMGGIQVIIPSTIKPENRRIFIEGYEAAQRFYQMALDAGEPPQNARALLPTGTKTELVMTCNLREWRHFIAMRNAKDAHPDIRLLASSVLTQLREIAASFFPEEPTHV
jgi:thymidylate synthase (FAD)